MGHHPGKKEQGLALRTGNRLTYKINAFSTLVAAFGLTAAWIAYKGPQGFTFLYDHWPALITASLANALVQAVYVYAASFQEGKLLAEGGNSGNVLFDWFIGRELNPRIGSFDIKTFNELRPGLIFWALLDFSCACHQYVALNGRITDSMVLVCLFHAFYVVDALFTESAIFSQMDITTDGFGFMLSVGDLTWVPFVYSLQARYLAFTLSTSVSSRAPSSSSATLPDTTCSRRPTTRRTTSDVATTTRVSPMAGSTRVSQMEADALGTVDLSFMTTKSGRKLITSGWWGRSRHPNYFGDWIMALSWSLPTGFITPITYFYFAFFVVLLVHRQLRDDHACRIKYGSDWDKYCKLVPSRIIPASTDLARRAQPCTIILHLYLANSASIVRLG